MFADQAKIVVISGKGGDGHVSFRREKYVPNGGPDGGDGGKGGSIILEVDDGLNTLVDYRHVRKYKATDGEEGQKRNCHGKDGEDLILKVPYGTVVKEFTTGKVIVDMSDDMRRFVLLEGGKGGNGNQHYATSTMQAPKYAQPGQPARELTLVLELKTIADVGLVGFPSVGKSTFLARVTNARPKIADYHFTTLSPNLGVVDLDAPGGGFIIADIPGLIEGASEGLGLGHQFLKHIERTKILIHIVDAASVEGRDPVEDIKIIRRELEKFNPELLNKPQVIAANKVDALQEDLDEEGNIISDQASLDALKKEFEPMGIPVYPISAVTGAGIKELLYYVNDVVQQHKDDSHVFEPEFFVDEHVPILDDPYTVTYDKAKKEYVVEGPRIEKMLGYTNLDSEKGFVFFQNFLKQNGIIKELEALGIQDGDTVRIYGFAFDYYK
ncbi:MAG: GTPase ObgE [Lachnospiraceae bacterium]|nr:GTPase ObgE [Lachnospiraceae bacterium]